MASAEGRVKPLARLLRCATALRVTAPLGYGSRRLVWPKGSLRPGKHGPKQPDNQDHPPPFPRKQRLPSDRPAAVQAAKRRSEPLTARTDLESFRARERGIQEEALKQASLPTTAKIRIGFFQFMGPAGWCPEGDRGRANVAAGNQEDRHHTIDAFFAVSINRYICIYLYCHRASSSAAKRLACQVAKAVDRGAGSRVAVALAQDTTG